MEIHLPNDFTPRPYQKPYMAYFDRGGKRAIWVCHRRAGKDLTAIHQECKMMHERVGMYWHIYPSFEQARKAIWEGFTRDGKRIMENVFPGFFDPKRAGSIVRRKDEQQMLVETKNGSIWRLLGSDRIEVVGAGPVGVCFSEYALAKPRAWNLIRPMLRENNGWASFITTPRGKNHAWEMFRDAQKNPAWFCQVLKLTDTNAFKEWGYKSATEVYDAERREGMPDALIRQEYDCDWTAALVGAIWGELIEEIENSEKVLDFKHPSDGVFTVWDLGISDSTAIWEFQISNNGSRFDLIDFYQSHGRKLSHFFDLLESRGRDYVKHWLPHDAIARTLQTGVSIIDQFIARYGQSKVARVPRLSLVDGIQAARWLLQQDIRFHSRCHEGIEALKHYHYEYDENEKTFGTMPEHDWASHPADAFRYGAIIAKMSDIFRPRPPEPQTAKPIAVPLNYQFTLDQLFEWHEEDLRTRRRVE